MPAPLPSARAPRRPDGINMLVPLLGLALLLAVLVGLAARGWTLRYAVAPLGTDTRAALSADASNLGYKREEDYLADAEAATTALWRVLRAPPGAQSLWENAETGNRGVIWGSQDQTQPDGSVCRTLERRTFINRAYRNAGAVACRDGQGRWEATTRWANE